MAVIYSKWPKYTNLFNSQALQNLPKLVFLVLKYTIWQPWSNSIAKDHYAVCLNKASLIKLMPTKAILGYNFGLQFWATILGYNSRGKITGIAITDRCQKRFPAFRQHFANTSPTFRQHFANISPTFRQHFADLINSENDIRELQRRRCKSLQPNSVICR
jgi:hypothetical protein